MTAQLVQGGGREGVLRFSFTSCNIRPCQMRQLKQHPVCLSCGLVWGVKYWDSSKVFPSLHSWRTPPAHLLPLFSFSGDLQTTFLCIKAPLGARFLALVSPLSIGTDQRHIWRALLSSHLYKFCTWDIKLIEVWYSSFRLSLRLFFHSRLPFHASIP